MAAFQAHRRVQLCIENYYDLLTISGIEWSASRPDPHIQQAFSSSAQGVWKNLFPDDSERTVQTPLVGHSGADSGS